jgi:chromosome segregation ATPase
MSIKKAIYEHLKTRKKYNTLELKYEVKCDELDHKVLELNTEKRLKQKQQELYDKKIKELTEENLELKNKITELKKEIKELKRRDND